ncbi:MAG: hypothetical protein ACRD2N_08920 [Vicinamibacterales bacterium]
MRVPRWPVAVGVVMGCGGSKGGGGTSTTSPTSPTPTTGGGSTVAFDVNGSWVGSAGGGRFTFTVSNSALTLITLSQFPGCATIYGFSLNAAVASNAFSYTIPSGNPDLSGTISGRFSSATSASGDMNVTSKSGCLGNRNSTWTASK